MERRMDKNKIFFILKSPEREIKKKINTTHIKSDFVISDFTWKLKEGIETLEMHLKCCKDNYYLSITI